ncbi:MAG: membrane dipeptidase [Clostridia bacterium]|nr:membrane dipeptidase [Clostridia bacterium]
MFVADAHCDTLYALAIEGRRTGDCAVTRNALEAGGVGLQTFALFAGRKGPKGTPYADGLAMMAAAPTVGVDFITGRLPEQPPETPTGIYSCEGGEMFEGSVQRLAEFQKQIKLRMVALTWNFENEIGFPAKEGPRPGLKPFGFKLLHAMDRHGILPDVSHLNETGFWDVCDHAALPPIASHSDCRWQCDVPRTLRKEQVKAIVERGGFIGINFYSYFLKEDGAATLDDAVRHIDEMCSLGAEHVLGFGSDFDGIEAWPEGLGDPTGFPVLLDALRKRGYSEQTLADIAGLNLWNLLKRAERQAARHRS